MKKLFQIQHKHGIYYLFTETEKIIELDTLFYNEHGTHLRYCAIETTDIDELVNCILDLV